MLFRDIIAEPTDALPTLITELLPTGLIGIMAAALLAALMSTIAAALNSTGTLVAVDIAKHFRHEFGDPEKGFEQSSLIVEREFRLEMVHQGYI